MNLEEIRQKYPQYNNLTDKDLSDKLYNKSYSNKMPIEEFYSKIGYQPQTQPQQQSLYNDVTSGLAGIPSRIAQGFSALTQLPGEAYGAITNPSRIPQNVAAGFGKLGDKLLNIPGNVRDWAVSRGLAPESLPKFRLTPEQYDYAQGVGLQDQKPGDALTQGLISNAPSAIAATIGALPLAVTEGLSAIGSNENPLTSAASAVLARELAKVGKKSADTGKNIYKASNKEKLGEKVLDQRKATSREANKLYKDVEKSVDNLDLGKIKTKTSNQDLKLLKKKLENDSVVILDRYLKNPNFKNTRSLTSDLFKYDKKNLSKLDKLTYTNEAVSAANSLRSNLLDSLEKSLKSKGIPGIEAFNKLQKANEFYKNQKVPFDKRLFKTYDSKKLSKENLVKKLSKNDEFLLSDASKKFPELKYVDAFNTKDLLKAALKGSAYGTGWLTAYSLFKGKD